MTELELSTSVLWAVVLVMGWHILRQRKMAPATAALPQVGLAPGTLWPSIPLRTLAGGSMELGHGRATCVLFLSTHCPTCRGLVPQLPPVMKAYPRLQMGILGGW
jgi:thiol-disulfide isomerase/thioredoxin